jgi:uncharacterized paraquat-inducible protein A
MMPVSLSFSLTAALHREGNAPLGRKMECHECGLRHPMPGLPDGTAARCIRCGATLHRFRASSLDHAFAYTCAGLALFLMADFLPFISLEISGLYRLVEVVGRWSMIDIFMISILVALVQFGELAAKEPGVGAVCFAALVIITMIAAMPFDPRLPWHAAGENHD